MYISFNGPQTTTNNKADLKTEANFFFLPQKFYGNPAGVPRKSFVILMGVQGLPTLCISAMILVALQNNRLIDTYATESISYV